MSNNVTVNIQGNTAGLQAALNSATTQLAAFNASASASASGATRMGSSVAGATRQVNTFNITVNNSTTVLSSFAGATGSAGSSMGNFLGGFAAIGGLQKFTELLTSSRDAVIKAEKSYKGLEAVAASVGVKIGDAMKVVKEVTKDGLMDNASASKSLQNLLAYGYTLQQSETLIKRLKDSSAYGAQAGKSIAEAVEGATEGLKNENSALVDNAGVTRNVAKMWEDYAGKQGLVAANLSESEKRTAAYNGILQETQAQLGNAAKYANSLGGEIAASDAKVTAMKETIGQAFTPAFQALNTAMGATADGVMQVVRTIQNLAAYTSMAITKLSIFSSWFSDFDASRVKRELADANKAFADFLSYQYKSQGAKFNADTNIKYGAPKTDGEDTVKDKYEKEKAAYDIMIGKAKEERDVKQKQYELDLQTLKKQLDDKVIALEVYKKKAIEINGQINASSQSFFEKVGSGLQKMLDLKYQPKEAELKVAISKNDADKKLADIKLQSDNLKISGSKISGGGAASGDSIAKAQYEQQKRYRELAFNEMQAINSASISLVDYQFQKFKISADTYYSALNKYLIQEFNLKQENIKKDIAGLENEKKKISNGAEKIKIDTEIKTLNSQLLTDESAFKQKYDENRRALEAYNAEIKKQKEFNSIDNDRANKDSDLSIKQIQNNIDRTMGGKVDINEDKIIENARFDNAKQSIEARRKYILENEKENTQELINLDKELADAQREHIVSIANLNAEAFLQSKSNYLDFMNTSRSAVAGFFTEINKHPKNFKEAVLNSFDTMHSKIMSMIAENYAKKLFDNDSVKNPINSFMNMMGFGGMQKQPDLKDDSVNPATAQVTKMTTELTTSLTSKLGGVFDGLSSMFSNFFSGLGNVLNSVFSSIASSGGSGGGGGIISMIGGFFSGIPALATGTNYVPKDNMLAFLHKGEAVVPAAYNNNKFGGGLSVTNNFRTDQPQSRFSQSQQAALAVDYWNRGTYNK